MKKTITKETSYLKSKNKLLTDEAICKPNKDFFSKFLDYEEYKLKRQNNLEKLDDGCYKTLNGYVGKFRNINKWFKNKPLKRITKRDIKKVYDDLEEGNIRTKLNTRFKDRVGYYNKIFKSKPFKMIGKAELAKEVIEFSSKEQGKVQFIELETFKNIVSSTPLQIHQLLQWLSFDLGENVNSLIQLKKKDFTLQINPDNNEQEYRINLHKEILKRSRTARSEITNFPETVKLLNMVLEKITNKDDVFPFNYDAARKVIKRSVTKANAKSIPDNACVTYKVLRNSMSCHLLKEGWTRDEINARLGHKPSSTEIDKYINFLAIDRHKPKKKLYDSNIHKLTSKLEETQRREKLSAQRIERLQKEMEQMTKFFKEVKQEVDKQAIKDIKKKLET